MQALQENTSYFNLNEDSLTTNELLSINASLPSSAATILQILYNNKTLQHKALAADTGMSITNLSNCISKMALFQPALLNIVKNGRSKFYSLTETGRKYVEQMILQNHSAKIRSFTSFSLESSKFDESMQLLQQFRESAGADWDITLIEILSNTQYTKSNTLYTLFTDFVNNLAWFKIHHKDESLEKIYASLMQNVLKKMLERHIDQFLKDYYILEPLFQLEKESIEDAYFIIDDLFGTFDSSADDSDSSTKMLLTDIQYNAIFHQFHIMKKDYCKHNYDKKAVIEYWKTVYHTINPILLYIAEKCCTLHKLQESI